MLNLDVSSTHPPSNLWCSHTPLGALGIIILLPRCSYTGNLMRISYAIFLQVRGQLSNVSGVVYSSKATKLSVRQRFFTDHQHAVASLTLVETSPTDSPAQMERGDLL